MTEKTQKRRVGGYVVRALLAAVAVPVVLTYTRFRRDMRAARERVRTGGGQVVETECGPIEYATSGDGPPVLVIHGAGGGYDQGLLISLVAGDGFRIIAPSRFGYLNSPVPDDDSIEAQAKLYACLLDTLDIERVAVVAFSAGGPSGLQFALDYPKRTTALILVSAVSYTEAPDSAERGQIEAVINMFTGSDLAYWLTLNVARPTLIETLGVSREVQARLTPEQQGQVDEVLEGMLPMSMRVDGIAIDQSRHIPRDYPLEDIDAPTLVVHALDDKLVPYANGQHSAASIPGAELVTLQDGGHFLAGRSDEVLSEVVRFLEEHAP